MNLDQFPVDLLRQICGYVVPNMTLKGSICKDAFRERTRMQSVCRTFRDFVVGDWSRVLKKRWEWVQDQESSELSPLFCRLFSDCLRYKQERCCQKTVLECLVPKDVLKSVPFQRVRLSQSHYAHLYDIDDVLVILKRIFKTISGWTRAFDINRKEADARRQKKVQRESRRDEIHTHLNLKVCPNETLQKLATAYIQRGSKRTLDKFKVSLQEYENEQRLCQERRDGLFHRLRSLYKGPWEEMEYRLNFYRVLSIDFVEKGVVSMDDTEVGKEVKRWIEYQKGCNDRRDELSSLLHRHGLKLRSDSHFCQEYINGSTECCAEEVVAVMRITAFLFERGGHVSWSEHHSFLESKLCLLHENMLCTWNEAADTVISEHLQ